MKTDIYVVGIGFSALTEEKREIFEKSKYIVTSPRLYERFSEINEGERFIEKIRIIKSVDETIEFIRKTIQKIKPITVLASGDPLFFGIGRRILAEFGAQKVEILPELSSIQIAFSKIKIPWDSVYFVSLHGSIQGVGVRKYSIDDIPALLRHYDKLCILTDFENTPQRIAEKLSHFFEKNSYIRLYVCEKLGYTDERITEGTVEDIKRGFFEYPNLLIVDKTGNSSHPIFGLKEGEIEHTKSLITKDEVRAVVIHKLRVPKGGIIWDIGAGSGSVSLEIAQISPQLKIFAIEKNEEMIGVLEKNRRKLSLSNVYIIKGEAPEALHGLPSPDRVFIGGSGGRLREILEFLGKLQCSPIAMTAVKIKTLSEALDCLKNYSYEPLVSQLCHFRMKEIGDSQYFSAQNPVFIIVGEKR